MNSILLTVLSLAASAASLNKGVVPGGPAGAALPGVKAAVPGLPQPAVAPAPAASAAVPQAPGALQSLQGEAARAEASAQPGQTDQGGASAAFDGGAAKADAGQLSELNKAIEEVLAPYNNNLTSAKVRVSRAETNADRAVAVEATVDYSKKGPDGDAVIKIEPVKYDYPIGGEPKTEANVSMKFNLLNVMTRDQINQMGPQADKMIAYFAKDWMKRYGPAAKIDARITRKDVDAQGNLTALGLSLGFSLDLAKLPKGMDPKGEPLVEAHLTLDVALDGLDGKLTFTSNKDARSFERGQTGLKEHIDRLVARDPKELAEIARYVKSIDSLAQAMTDKSKRR